MTPGGEALLGTAGSSDEEWLRVFVDSWYAGRCLGCPVLSRPTDADLTKERQNEWKSKPRRALNARDLPSRVMCTYIIVCVLAHLPLVSVEQAVAVEDATNQ